jgi:hypothetical protein
MHTGPLCLVLAGKIEQPPGGSTFRLRIYARRGGGANGGGTRASGEALRSAPWPRMDRRADP